MACSVLALSLVGFIHPRYFLRGQADKVALVVQDDVLSRAINTHHSTKYGEQ